MRREARPPARDFRPILWVGLALLCAAPAAQADDPLYYFVEGQGVVITNTPSRADAVPVMQPARGGVAAGAARGRAARAGGPGGGATLPATRYDGLIDNVAAEAGLSPRLIKAVALVESGFDPRAVSPKGAQGLMQLMPATARAYGVTDPFDPRQNLRAGASHLRDLMDEFDGDLPLVLAAYNAGPAAVRRSGGVPDYRETQDYVRRIHARLGDDPGSTAAPPPPRPAVPVRMIRLPDGSVTLQN